MTDNEERDQTSTTSSPRGGSTSDGSKTVDGLAVTVDKPQTERSIAALRDEGVYDETRSVMAINTDETAIPVDTPPVATSVNSCRRLELPLREPGLEDLLAAYGCSDRVIEAAPSSWAVIGSIIVVDFGEVSATSALTADQRHMVGKALLDLHAHADTVIARGGIVGTQRVPSHDVIAGIDETETIHTEHGTKYAVDLATVMFSPGNKAERARMGEIVGSGERVFDMFAGIGYFTLPMARAGAQITATEINPEAYRFLVENIALNNVTDHVQAVLGDCRDVETTADRVVMGYFDAYQYLDTALSTLTSDGVVHLHEATPQSRFPDRPIQRLKSAGRQAGRDITILASHHVKSYSPGIIHGVIDAKIQ